MASPEGTTEKTKGTLAARQGLVHKTAPTPTQSLFVWGVSRVKASPGCAAPDIDRPGLLDQERGQAFGGVRWTQYRPHEPDSFRIEPTTADTW